MKLDLTILGITKNEEKVYLTLLHKGKSLAGQLSQNTGIHRRTIYDITERLIEKGLVSYISENNKKYFYASNPERFKDIQKEQENYIENILPELTNQYNSQKENKKTTFYQGKQGIKTIFAEQLKQEKEILIIGASTEAYETLLYYFPHYDKERKEKKIHARIIFNVEAKKKLKKIPYAKIKYFNENHNTSTNIYGNTVSIITWGENPYAIVINDKSIADSYRYYFEILWKNTKEL